MGNVQTRKGNTRGVGLIPRIRCQTHAALGQVGRSADVGVGYKAAVPVAGTGVGVPGVGDLTHAALGQVGRSADVGVGYKAAVDHALKRGEIVSPNERREARASLVNCTGVVSMIEETTI